MRFNSFPRLFLFLTIASIPFSVRTFFYDASGYASGMFFESTAIFLNLTEILLWLTFVSFLINQTSASFRPEYFAFLKAKMQWKNLKVQIIFLLAFLFINLATAFWAKDPKLSFLFALKIIEGILLVWLMTKEILSKKEIFRILILLGLFESSLAIAQFVLQHDLDLRFLGEPNLAVDILGVAKIEIGAEKLLRGYGTFAHPNILGAFLVILFFYLDQIKIDKLKYLILIPLFFTFSRSAFLAIFVGLLTKAFLSQEKFKKILGTFLVMGFCAFIFFLLFPQRFLWDQSISERVHLIQTAWQMFLAHPFGVGNGNFLLNMQDFYPQILKPWEFQPVHNLYLLVLTENGFLGFLAFVGFLTGLLITLFKKQKEALPLFLAILILGLFDHYFWDLDSGRWLFWLGVGMIYLSIKEFKNQH